MRDLVKRHNYTNMATTSQLEKLIQDVRAYTQHPIFKLQNAKTQKYTQFKGKIITYEGPISAGKTTLVNNTVAFFNENGIPACGRDEKYNKKNLGLFYSGLDKTPNPYAYSFQLDMLRQAQKVYVEAEFLSGRKGGPSNVVVTDRTVLGNAAFASVHHASGNMSEDEFSAYLSCLEQDGPYSPDYIVYLDVEPDKALKRIKLRARPEEQDIPINYLELLDKVYYLQIREQLLAHQSNIVVLSNDSFYEVENVLERLLHVPKEPPKEILSHELNLGTLTPAFIRGKFRDLCRWYTC